MERIYLADDKKEIREIVTAFLRSDGYDVTSFENEDLLLEEFQ